MKSLKGSSLIVGGLTLLALLLPLFVASPVATANEGIVIYDNLNVEGYHIIVMGRPNPITVGKVSLLVRLAKPTATGSEAPVRGAKMTVQFQHVSGPGSDKSDSYLQRADLTASESEPGTYEVSDSLQNEGVYRITLKTVDGAKTIAPSFELTARPQPDDRIPSVLLLAIFPLLLAGLLYFYLKKPSGQDGDSDNGSAEVKEPQEVKV